MIGGIISFELHSIRSPKVRCKT